jgi:hypothetical protein
MLKLGCLQESLICSGSVFVHPTGYFPREVFFFGLGFLVFPRLGWRHPSSAASVTRAPSFLGWPYVRACARGLPLVQGDLPVDTDRQARLPEHAAIASQAGDRDRERLPQTSKTGKGRAPVRSAELEPGDGGIAAVPADDPPREGVGRGRPGDSQLITSRPNNAEGITTRVCGTAPEGPVRAGCL